MEESKQARFIALYKPISSRLSNYCRHITDSPADAEDLLHDTVVASFEGLEQLKSEAAFPAFMYSTAYNIYSKHMRRKRFKGRYNEEAAAFLKNVDASPELITELSIIFEKMKQLPAEQYEAMLLYYVSDLSQEDIAAIQQVTLSAVKSRIQRGKDKLLRLLNDKHKQLVLTLF